jgi:hypothetical protein
MALGPVGQILPGTVKVEEIIAMGEETGQRWYITLIAQPSDARNFPLLEATVKFVTADRVLVDQLRHRKLRYALDLVQIGDTGEDGEMDIGTWPQT